MAKYRMVRTEFWMNTMDFEEMTWEEMYFQLYLLTNPHTTQIGIYKITKRQIAFEMRISIDKVHSLLERFIHQYKLISYNSETTEVAIKYWGKYNLHKGGKPIMDCIYSELKEVIDTSLISYVSESIPKEEIRRLYESFCREDNDHDINRKNLDIGDKVNDTFTSRDTIRGQKEKENKKENKKQQHNAYVPKDTSYKAIDMQEIIEFWDRNGFGYSNANGKNELLFWLEHSGYLYPKDWVIKAMAIASSNNKRKLSYVVGVLKNWENEDFLRVEEMNSCQKKHKTLHKQTDFFLTKRAFPKEFVFDITAGEEQNG